MKRNIELTLEQAQKIYKEQPKMRELLLTTFTKDELEEVTLKNWEDLGEILRMMILKYFVTEKQAKSAFAMAHLSLLMKNIKNECDVNWNNDEQTKYTIIRQGNFIAYPITTTHNFSFLAFKTPNICSQFATKHRQLINDYFMID